MLNPAVYKIENKINGFIYIGSTINYIKRIKEHVFYLRRNKHCSKKLQEDFNKFGIDAFDFSILESYNKNKGYIGQHDLFDKNLLKREEKLYIQEENQNLLYNTYTYKNFNY